MLLRQRIARFCVRCAVLCLVTGVLLNLPEPDADSVLHLKNALVVLGFVIGLGKVLYDTFFYERFQ